MTPPFPLKPQHSQPPGVPLSSPDLPLLCQHHRTGREGGPPRLSGTSQLRGRLSDLFRLEQAVPQMLRDWNQGEGLLEVLVPLETPGL